MSFTRFRPSRPPPPTLHGRVLYIEDNIINWEVAHRALVTFDMHRARSSQEAFGILQESRFDILLVDIALPESDLNGIEIVRVLTGRFVAKFVPEYAVGVICAAPAIFVTGAADLCGRAELIDAGAVDVFGKPVDFRALALRMRELVG